MNGLHTPAGVRALLGLLTIAAVTVGCGEGKLQSPTGPSAAIGSTASVAAGGSSSALAAGSFDALGRGGVPGPNDGGNGNPGGNGNGNGNGNGGGNGGGDETGDVGAGGPGRSHEARVVGFVTARSVDTLLVNSLTVAATPNTLIRHGNLVLTLDQIEVGDHVQARGTMEGPVLVAMEIKVQDTGDDNDDIIEADVDGVIAGLASTAGCPVVTFTVGPRTVTTSATTIFDDIACGALANNLFVEVEGILQPDGTILATKVEAEAGPDDVEGFVFDFSGAASCPAATFFVGPTRNLATQVTTTASTVFRDVTCAALTNGVRVEVEGTRQADGSIAAAAVEFED